MIYALKYGSVSGKVRQEIRLAIARQGDLAPYVAQGLIAHIASSHPGGDYHCLYCGDQLKPYALARPGKRAPADNWYFQHMGKNKCIGPASTPTSDFKKPEGHGCFVCLGCETDDAGMPTAQHRTRCHTIVNGQTYCHLAQRDGCIPGGAQETEAAEELAESTDAPERQWRQDQGRSLWQQKKRLAKRLNRRASPNLPPRSGVERLPPGSGLAKCGSEVRRNV